MKIIEYEDTLPDKDGNPVSLSGFAGKKVMRCSLQMLQC